MEKQISILLPAGCKAEFKQMSDVSCHDIGLDLICSKLSDKAIEQKAVMMVMAQMTDDPHVSKYRAEVFDDIINFPEMREKMIELLEQVKFLNDYSSFKRDYDAKAGLWELLHRLNELNDYIKSVEAIRDCLSSYDIKSEGLKALKAYVEDVYSESHFAELKKDVAALRADTQSLKSITIGINLNRSFEAEGIGLISVNNKEFKSSGILGNFADAIMTKEGIKDGNEWKGEYRYHPISAEDADFTNSMGKAGMVTHAMRTPMAGILTAATLANVPDKDPTAYLTHYFDREVSQMLAHITKKLGKLLAKYVGLSITHIVNLIPEFMYYIRWAEYIEKLRNQGYSFCRPQVYEKDETVKMKAEGIYNLKLAFTATEEGQIVKNDLTFDSDISLYILTGANRGGKTTITQAIGQLFVLAQGGIYVPGDSFSFSPADCIYTHFPADEDKTMDLGRLGEECRRFKSMYGECSGKSLMLLNETFSTTSFEEGYYIARDSVKAILSKGVCTIYNTHMHKLAFDIDELNEFAKCGKAASLVVRSEGGKRSFKIEIAPPEGMSYAKDIAEKYGVTYKMLTEEG